jgi:hypothetical protein|tara:strand:- start:523 stop:705 length:183 start_codon:yes stop_codon:yes gene_type:complete
MEIKRYYSIYFLLRELKKDLFNVDVNNSTDEASLMFLQLKRSNFSSECKKIDIDKWKKIN